jgi:hypothetical protein
MTTCDRDAGNHDVEALCADHLRREESLLASALEVARGMKDAFTGRSTDDAETDPARSAPEALVQALARHTDYAQLLNELSTKREALRQSLAAHLGLDPKLVTLARVVRNLPHQAGSALASELANVRGLAEQLAALNYWLSVHLRVHLDAYRRILRDLTNTSSGSGRYGPAGVAESLEYRPLIQLHG